MGFLNDLKMYAQILRPRLQGATHAERLESFYAGQADSFDEFRKNMLCGREELMTELPVPENGVWVDLGGGTGSNLYALGDRLMKLRKLYLVDLSDSLLAVAQKRIDRMNWTPVEIVKADMALFTPPLQPVDVVTCSYSLSMTPNWIAVLDHARRMLRPGGMIGVVDFYVSLKHPAAGHVRHSWLTRRYWPVFFRHSHVRPSGDQMAYLFAHFQPQRFVEGRSRIPYFPWLKPPYYRFIGQKPAEKVGMEIENTLSMQHAGSVHNANQKADGR